MTNITDNITHIRQRMEAACMKAGRSPEEVRLLLATKTVLPENIIIALQHGETLIAENKIQEIKQKSEDLKAFPHEQHFIGHLQSNKIKDVLKYNVSCIQSLDRLELAEKLHQRLSQERRKIDVLVQVNTSDEQSKFGVAPDAALELVKRVSTFDAIQVKGLMTIGLFSSDHGRVRACFRRLNDLRQEIASHNIPGVIMKELSMGMSNDLEIAIEEGATVVRVGTAIFGKRAYPDSYYWNENK